MGKKTLVPIYFTNKRVIFPFETISFIINEKINDQIGVIAIETDVIQLDLFEQDNIKTENIFGTLGKIVNKEKSFFFDNEKNSTTYKFKIEGVCRFKVEKFL